MFEIFKRVTLGALLLAMTPVLVYSIGWQWYPGVHLWGLEPFYWLTQTVTRPWGTLTSLVLGVWLFYQLKWSRRVKWSRKRLMGFVFSLVVVVWGGQGLNVLLKNHFNEPRPYSFWITTQQVHDPNEFYALPAKQRQAAVSEATASEQYRLLPKWQRNHWIHEVGYSFPSGHSLFVSCWVLLMLAFLKVKAHIVTHSILMMWAALIMWSRMALGMHWPWDIMAAIAIAWLLVSLLVMIGHLVTGRNLDE